MARRRRKVGITRTLFRAWRARQKRNATARRVAQKRAAAAQKVIQRESRTTAGKLRAGGQVEWNAQGMPDSTVMEPVMRNGRHTGEWMPARQQPRKRAAGAGRPPEVPGMRAVRDGQGWAYVPVMQADDNPVTTLGEIRSRPGTTVAEHLPDGTRVRLIPNANRKGYTVELVELGPDHQTEVQAERNRARGACGAPTQNNTPCERIGDCPVPKHITWRNAHNR